MRAAAGAGSSEDHGAGRGDVGAAGRLATRSTASAAATSRTATRPDPTRPGRAYGLRPWPRRRRCERLDPARAALLGPHRPLSRTHRTEHEDLVHHRRLARLRPRVGRSPRSSAATGSPPPRATPRTLDDLVEQVRRARCCRCSSTSTDREADFAAVQQGFRALRPARRRRQQRRLRTVRHGRGADRGRSSATRSRPTSSARCGSPRRRCRSCASRAAATSSRSRSIGGISAFPTSAPTTPPSGRSRASARRWPKRSPSFGIKVTLIEPGGFSTDWGGASAKHADQLAGVRRGPREGGGAGGPSAPPRRVTRSPPVTRSWRSSTPSSRRCGCSSATTGLDIADRRLRAPAGDLARVAAAVGRRPRLTGHHAAPIAPLSAEIHPPRGDSAAIGRKPGSAHRNGDSAAIGGNPLPTRR